MDLRLEPGAKERSACRTPKNSATNYTLDQLDGPSPLCRSESVDSGHNLSFLHLFPGGDSVEPPTINSMRPCDPVGGWGRSPGEPKQDRLFKANAPYTSGGSKGAWRKERIRNAEAGLTGEAPDTPPERDRAVAMAGITGESALVGRFSSRKFVALVDDAGIPRAPLNVKAKAVKWVAKPNRAVPAGSDMWCGTSRKLERFSGNLKKNARSHAEAPLTVRHSTSERRAHEGFTNVAGRSSVHRTGADGLKILSNREAKIARGHTRIPMSATLPDSCSSVVSFSRRKIGRQSAKLPRDYGGVELRRGCDHGDMPDLVDAYTELPLARTGMTGGGHAYADEGVFGLDGGCRGGPPARRVLGCGLQRGGIILGRGVCRDMIPRPSAPPPCVLPPGSALREPLAPPLMLTSEPHCAMMNRPHRCYLHTGSPVLRVLREMRGLSGSVSVACGAPPSLCRLLMGACGEELAKNLLLANFGPFGAALVAAGVLYEFSLHWRLSEGRFMGRLASIGVAMLHFGWADMPINQAIYAHAAFNVMGWLSSDTFNGRPGGVKISAMLAGKRKKPRRRGGNSPSDTGSAFSGDWAPRPPKVKPDEVIAHIASRRPYILVVDKGAPCVGLMQSQECYVPHGADSVAIVYQTGRVLRDPVVSIHNGAERLGVLSGYKPIHAGCYAAVNYDDCYTLAECHALEDDNVYQLEPCGAWRTLPAFDFNVGGTTIHSQATDVYVVHALLKHVQGIVRGKTSDAQFEGAKGNLAAAFPAVKAIHIHNAVLAHTHDLIRSRLLSSDSIVRVGQVLAANTEGKQKEMKDALGLGGQHEWAECSSGRQPVFERAKIPYVWYPYLKKIPGVSLNGVVSEGYTFDPADRGSTLVVIPPSSKRWRVVGFNGNVKFMENYAHDNFRIGGVVPRSECRLPYFPDPNFARFNAGHPLEVGYRSAGTPVRSSHPSGHVTVYQVSPTALLDAVYGRALLETPGEPDLVGNQLKVVMHLRYLDPDLYSRVVKGMLHGNDREATAAAFADDGAYAAEVASMDHYGGECVAGPGSFWAPSNSPWEKLTDDRLMRIGRRAAAAVLSERYAAVRSATEIRAQSSFYIGGAMTFAFGLLYWHYTGAPTLSVAYGRRAASAWVLTRCFAGGLLATLGAAVTAKCSEAFYTWVGGTKTTHTVDEAGFAHEYNRYPIFGSSLYQMWMAVNRTHVKMKVYIRLLQRWYTKEPTAFVGDHVDVAMSEADVLQKAHEGSKFGKVARFVVTCGQNTLTTQVAAGLVKEAFSGRRFIGGILRRVFPAVPSEEYVQEVLHTLPAEPCRDEPTHYMSNCSDDEYMKLNFGGVVKHVCADASGADSSVQCAISCGMLPALYADAGVDIPIKSLVHDFVRPWKVTSPAERHTWFTIQAVDAAMPSGNANTTLLQNIFSLMRQASFAACVNATLHARQLKLRAKIGQGGNYQAPPSDLNSLLTNMVRVSAAAIGGRSTVELSDDPQKATLLKRTYMRDLSGVYQFLLVPGAILSNFGSYQGDLTPEVLGVDKPTFDRMSLSARWDRRNRCVVAGLKNEPSSPVVVALRARFPGGEDVDAVGPDEKFKQDMLRKSRDRSGSIIPLSEYIIRYGGDDASWADFLHRLRWLQYGEILEHPIMHLIRADYGVAPVGDA